MQGLNYNAQFVQIHCGQRSNTQIHYAGGTMASPEVSLADLPPNLHSFLS